MTTRRAGNADGTATHDAHSPDNPAAEAGMSRDAINIGRHIMKRAIAAKLAEGEYTQEQCDLLEWLYGYAFQALHGSRNALVGAVGYDWTTIFRAWNGTYGAGIANVCEAVQHLKNRASEGATELVETVVTQRIFQALDYARDTSAMVLISGPTGRSKTFAAEHWIRGNNHGRGIYVRCRSASTKRRLVHQICRSAGIGYAGKKTGDLEERLFGAFDWKNTLIFDEAGHVIPRGRASGTDSLEFIRDLHDICGCGVALIVTDVYWDELRHGPLKRFFEQFIGRVKFPVQIPPRIFREEISAVCSAFVPDPCPELLRLAADVANAQDGRLRTLFEDMRRAKKAAAREGVPLTDRHLKMAVRWRDAAGLWPDK